MQKQRREQYERRVLQKRHRQIEIAISARRGVEVKDESRQTQRREMQDKRRAATLLEQDEETDQQIRETDQVDVDDAWRPAVNRAQVVEVGPVVLCLGRIGRTLHSIVQLTAYARLVQID